MGAADVVPGVSGGTIAFITGIYEELIDTLNGIRPQLLQILFKEGIGAFWTAINGWFLLFLLAGVGTSIVSLAKGITYLLDTQPVLIWSFFFGLILASSYTVGKQVKQWNAGVIVVLIVGIVAAVFITSSTPTQTPEDLWFIFISGMIAICAMILPGISGSFILLLLGKYQYILESLKELKISVILTFMAGCVIGLVSFSHVLSWMFKKYHNATIAVLTGFMIGSLKKVWPWKNVLETRINSHGKSVPFIDESVMPSSFIGDPQIVFAVVFMLIGLALVLLLDKFSPTKAE